MSKRETAKVALITGAAGGIGRATVDVFLVEGWQVVALDREQAERPLPDDVQFLRVDLSAAREIERLGEELSERLPAGLHALVNNAAMQITKKLVETDPEEWDALMAVNLRAPYLLAKALYPALKRGRAAIVNVASVHALATSAEIGAYAASKGGLLALTRAMAIEFAADRVRVNAVLPGATDTAMLEAGLSRSSLEGENREESGVALAEKILLGRVARPEEIGRAIFFLADEKQSSYITGQPLVVDGGATAQLSIE